jgi:hypothetical protein
MRLFRTYDLICGFNKLTLLTRCFFLFLIDVFFSSQFHLLILGWLGIRLRDLFWYTYYEVISIFWLRSWVWRVERGWLESFLVSFFFIFFFYNFIFYHWVDWELNFIICFNFSFLLGYLCFITQGVGLVG